MTTEDREEFAEIRPYVVGVIALLFRLTKSAWTNSQSFSAAEEFVKDFERDA